MSSAVLSASNWGATSSLVVLPLDAASAGDDQTALVFMRHMDNLLSEARMGSTVLVRVPRTPEISVCRFTMLASTMGLASVSIPKLKSTKKSDATREKYISML